MNDPFIYKVVWESANKMLHEELFASEIIAKSYAAFRRQMGIQKTEIWRQSIRRDELGEKIINETMIEKWPFE